MNGSKWKKGKHDSKLWYQDCYPRWKEGMKESWERQVGRGQLSNRPGELVELYHTEGHWNLFFFLITGGSLCLDSTSVSEGKTISHTLAVKSFPLEGFPDGFKCVTEAMSDIWEQTVVSSLVAWCGASRDCVPWTLVKKSSGKRFRSRCDAAKIPRYSRVGVEKRQSAEKNAGC